MGEIFGILLLLACAFAIVSFIIQQNEKAKTDALQRAFTISDVDNMDGIAFEHYVAKLLRSEGYTNVEVSKGSGDFGVDVTASKGGLRYAIQVKRYTGTVSRRAVSDAVAGKGHYSCDAAMVVTNSYLTRQAKEFAASVRCEIVDRDILGEWILRFQASGHQEQSITPPQIVKSPQPPVPNLLEPQLGTSQPSSDLRDQKAASIPSDVLQRVKACAALQHPNDFSTQAYVVGEQIAAYLALRKLRPSRVPEEALDKVLERAELDYPENYSTRLYVIEEQLAAYLELNKLIAKNIPVEIFETIKNEASRNYPDNFSTRLYVIKEQMKSYEALARIQ